MKFNYIVRTNFGIRYCTSYTVLPYNRGIHLNNATYSVNGGLYIKPMNMFVNGPFEVEQSRVYLDKVGK